jgi:tetratricopeptide (TPR) repeat protein
MFYRITKVFFVLFFCLGFLSRAQVSSEAVERYERGDVDEKINQLMQFFAKLPAVNQDTVLYFIDDLQSAGVEEGRKDAIAFSDYIFGHYLNDQSLFDEAKSKLNNAKAYYARVKDDTLLSLVNNALGNNNYLNGELKKAEANYLKSVELGKKSKQEKFQFLPYANLARIYIHDRKFSAASDILDEYIAFNEKINDVRSLGTAYGIYGQLYIEKNDDEQAADYLSQSLHYNLLTKDPAIIANGYTNNAIAAFLSDDFNRAKEYFHYALTSRFLSGNKYFIAEAYFNLGDFFLNTNQMDSALYYFDRSLEVSRASDNLIGERDALEQMAAVYDSINAFHEETEVLKSYINVLQRLNAEKETRELMAMRLSFEQGLSQNDFVHNQREDELNDRVNKVDDVWGYWVWFMIFGLIAVSFTLFYIRKRKKGT